MIKLKNFNLELFDSHNEDHKYILSNLSSNTATNQFISKNLSRFIENTSNNKEIDKGATFIVKDSEDIVGIFGTKEMDEHGILEVWCTIDPEKRGKKYATRILEEITPYLIENIKNLNDIKLVIDRRNIYSKKIANEVGYVKLSENGETETYRYFGK